LGVLWTVPDRRVFGFGVQFVEAADRFIPVKDASSAGRLPAGSFRRFVRFRGAWESRSGGGDIVLAAEIVKVV